MSAVYKEACCSQKMPTNGQNFSKKDEKYFNENRPRRLTGVRTPTMIKLVDDTIQSDRRMKVEDVAHRLNISAGIAYEIIDKDFGYSKVSCQ